MSISSHIAATNTVKTTTTFLILSFFVSAPLFAEEIAEEAIVRQASNGCESSAAVYTSVEQAVQQLSLCFHQLSFDEDREYIAALLEEDGTLTAVIQHAEPGEHQVTLRFSRKPTQTLVALWHTHGARGSARNYFSPEDTAVAEQLGVPFYLTDPAGKITRYEPGKNKRRTPRAPGPIPYGSVKGTLVGRI